MKSLFRFDFFKSKPLATDVLVFVATILLIIRAVLPIFILHYALKQLNQIPEYKADIQDLSLHLYKGGYVLKKIDLKKINGNIPVPFFAADTVELTLQWKALLKGALVGQIIMENPTLNFVYEPNSKNQQLTINQQWQDAVKNLFPLNFNRIILNNGQIHLRSYTSKPKYDLYIKNVQAQVDNMKNVERNHKTLFSSLNASGQTLDGAPLKLHVDFNPFAKQPTFDLTMELKNLQIPAINPILQNYTHNIVKQGLFSLYVETAAANGKITGYAKPMLKNVRVDEPKEKNKSPVQALYKAVMQAAVKILENPKTKMIAAKIPISGNIENPDTSIWSTIFSLLKNAFIRALLPGVDNTIEFKDAIILTNSYQK